MKHLYNSFLKWESFLVTDCLFWNWLGLTRNRNEKICIKSHFYFACEALITQRLRHLPPRPHLTPISQPPSSPCPHLQALIHLFLLISSSFTVASKRNDKKQALFIVVSPGNDWEQSHFFSFLWELSKVFSTSLLPVLSKGLSSYCPPYKRFHLVFFYKISDQFSTVSSTVHCDLLIN